MIILLCNIHADIIIIKRMYCKKTKIFIGGISKKLTQCNLILIYNISRPSKYFSKYCDILDCVIIIDKTTSKYFY